MSNPSQIIRIRVGSPLPPLELAPVARQEPQAPVQISPLIDIYECAEGLVLEADLPGASEEGLTVQLADNILTLEAQVAPAGPPDAEPLHREFGEGVYYRSFILSDEVDRERIRAELKQGVLRLIMPRAQKREPRKIEVKST